VRFSKVLSWLIIDVTFAFNLPFSPLSFAITAAKGQADDKREDGLYGSDDGNNFDDNGDKRIKRGLRF